MPRQLFIDDHIEMRGDALHRSNMDGPWQETKRHDWDRFTGIAIDSTNRWAVEASLGTGDTIAISEVQGGSVLMTTGSVDNDSEMLSTAIIYSADKKAICEWRITITDVSGTGLFVGFSDAKVEINNSIAIHYPDDTLTTVATNAVGFVIDADHSTSSIMCEGVKAGTDATSDDTDIDWADGETKVLRVELDVDGNAVFLVDGNTVGYVANAVTDSTLLCATVQAITRANDGSNTVRLRSYDAWQDD